MSHIVPVAPPNHGGLMGGLHLAASGVDGDGMITREQTFVPASDSRSAFDTGRTGGAP